MMSRIGLTLRDRLCLGWRAHTAAEVFGAAKLGPTLMS
jgi:hypothetical protein